MENNEKTSPEKDPKLWEIARKRASFKSNLITYCIVNAFLWILWFLTSNDKSYSGGWNFPWPIWPTLGWGIGILFHYFDAYVYPKANSAEKEYEKLKQKEQNK
jgi:hypothetical protein